MAETHTPNDKTRKSRSFGAFLLFLTVLVAILIAYGGEHMRAVVKLTQDQYEYLLYRGYIDRQVMRGQNVIEGQLEEGAPTFREDDPRAKRDQPFEVSFAGLEQNARLYQQVKATRTYELVDGDVFLSAVARGWYDPKTARVITTSEDHTTPQRNGGDAEGRSSAKRGSSQSSYLYANVLAVSKSEALSSEREAANRASEPADPEHATDQPAERDRDTALPPLPEQSGSLWVEVRSVGDMGEAIAALEQAGARTEFINLDLSRDKGTKWSDSNSLLTVFLVGAGPWILMLVLFFVFMRQMRSQGGAGGVMSFGRSRATLYSKDNHTNVTFDDVAGAQEAKDEVREVVEFLKNPSRFTRIGGRIPRGILLVGPPGCGKTLLAKAIAGEAEVPFFSISGSDFVEMFVGVGASRVRDLFKNARENSPCIIFLDEIDAVGRRRGSGLGGGHDEREQTLNAILVEMDGFGTDEGIIVIAATNRPDVLDPALLRPGRFDREVVIDLPDVEGREEILRVHLKKVKAAPDVEVKTVARLTPGYSGADLAAIINEAAIRAALQKKETIGMDDLEEAREKVRYGRQKRSRKLELEDKKITAYHEAGHALVAASIPEIDRPHKVTIVPRGRSLGVTWVLPEKESYHLQKKRLSGQLAWMFGGRVAEQEFCGDISAGASDDIRRATDLARAMVSELGMSAKIGPINYAERQGSEFLGTELMRSRTHSEETAREIDEEVKVLLTQAYERAREIIQAAKQPVEAIAQALLTYETISGEEIERLMHGARPEDLRPGAPPTAPTTEPRKAPTPAPGKAAGDGQPGELPGLQPA